jgi:hypothetical protein
MAAKPNLVKEAGALPVGIPPWNVSCLNFRSQKMDKKTRLVIDVLQQAIQREEMESEPAKYLKKFRSEIRTTGRLFEYLGLARADKQSPMGWRPAAALVELMIKSKARHSKLASLDEDTVFQI